MTLTDIATGWTKCLPLLYKSPEAVRISSDVETLSAALPFVPGYQREAGEVALILGQGCVHTCTIRAADGLSLLQGGEALKTLERLGSLEWHVQRMADSSDAWSPNSEVGQDTRQSQEHAAEHIIPHRLVAHLSPVQQQKLSRHHRQIFSLVDGFRSIASIAALLHLSPDQVARLLQELRQDRLID